MRSGRQVIAGIMSANLYHFYVPTQLEVDGKMIRTAFVALSLFAIPHAVWRTYAIFK